jgi:DNA-directed RNA polymerase sigma subunit (sigma70/sigma32)
MIPPVITTLTQEEQFELVKFRRDADRMTKDQLVNTLINVAKQYYVQRANVRQLVKHSLKKEVGL